MNDRGDRLDDRLLTRSSVSSVLRGRAGLRCNKANFIDEVITCRCWVSY